MVLFALHSFFALFDLPPNSLFFIRGCVFFNSPGHPTSPEKLPVPRRPKCTPDSSDRPIRNPQISQKRPPTRSGQSAVCFAFPAITPIIDAIFDFLPCAALFLRFFSTTPFPRRASGFHFFQLTVYTVYILVNFRGGCGRVQEGHGA